MILSQSDLRRRREIIAIDRSGGGRTSWLYGTVHVARLPWMFPGPAVVKALNASRTVALELDMLDPDIARRLSAAAKTHRIAALDSDQPGLVRHLGNFRGDPPSLHAGKHILEAGNGEGEKDAGQNNDDQHFK